MSADASTIQLSQLLLTGIAALLGTLAAGAIGLLFGLAQFRRERAFERRLEWHEAAVKKFVHASKSLHGISMALQIPELNDKLATHMSDAVRAEIGEELDLQAEMYARKDTYNAICQARADQRRIVLSIIQLENSQRSGTIQDDQIDYVKAQMFELTAKSMLHAASMLAQDVRDFLNLDKLDRRSRLYDKKHRANGDNQEEDVTEFLNRMHSDEERSLRRQPGQKPPIQ